MKNLLLTLSLLATVLVLAPAFLSAAGDAEKGKEVFQQCGVCHHTDSVDKKLGPGLKGLFKKAKLANGKPANDANVLAVINEGGNGMPAYKDILTSEEKDHLMAYLKTL